MLAYPSDCFFFSLWQHISLMTIPFLFPTYPIFHNQTIAMFINPKSEKKILEGSIYIKGCFQGHCPNTKGYKLLGIVIIFSYMQ